MCAYANSLTHKSVVERSGMIVNPTDTRLMLHVGDHELIEGWDDDDLGPVAVEEDDGAAVIAVADSIEAG